MSKNSANNKIALSEAKARFSELVERVGKGEEFVITKHEQVIARLIPARGRSRDEIRQAVEGLKILRQSVNISLDEMIAWKNEGRA